MSTVGVKRQNRVDVLSAVDVEYASVACIKLYKFVMCSAHGIYQSGSFFCIHARQWAQLADVNKK